MATLTRDPRGNRDMSRQPGTLARQFDRRNARNVKMTMHTETAASFATFAKNHNARVARRAGA